MTTTPTHSELLPCPFCGSEKIRCDHDDYGWLVDCQQCGASIPADPDPKKAVRAWNQRDESRAVSAIDAIMAEAELLRESIRGLGHGPAQPVTDDDWAQLASDCGVTPDCEGRAEFVRLMRMVVDQAAKQPVTVSESLTINTVRAAMAEAFGTDAMNKEGWTPQKAMHAALVKHMRAAESQPAMAARIAAAIGRADKRPVTVSEEQVEASLAASWEAAGFHGISSKFWNSVDRKRMRAALEQFAAAIGRGGDGWTKEVPTEQAYYWHWDGDEDSAPLLWCVLKSGSDGHCFTSANQHGVTHSIACADWGGWWLRSITPKTPEAR